MNLMNALLDTYDFALNNDLVDNHRQSDLGHVLLPVYHSNRKSNGEDIFEITIDEDSNAISGSFLDKDESIIFPITEGSITRSGSKIAPHAICDELSYLADEIDEDKNNEYLKGINKLLEYEKSHNNKNFRIIGEYINNNNILEDFLKYYMGNTNYSINKKWLLKFEVSESKGESKIKSIDLKKLFITFKINKLLESDVTLTRDTGIHKFYINYVNNINSSMDELSYCDITGDKEYCIERHRGIIGMAKLVSVSNNDETYYGRIQNSKDIYHISFEGSQKVHNMLKFFLDSDKYKKYIGENAYLINWLSNDLNKGRMELISDEEYEDDEVDEITFSDLGDSISNKLGDYFLGINKNFESAGNFYVLVIEKISNGRISIKYFRRLSRSEAYERVNDWYNSTDWSFYDYQLNKYISKSPSIHQIVNFVYGGENSKGFLSCENKKLMRTSIERLIPCIIDAKKLPRDITRAAHHRLSNKRSYKKSWNTALNIGCALVKKHMYDYENIKIYYNKLGEVPKLKKSRSYYYGRLMAIYEKVEMDATRTRIAEGTKQEKGQNGRITNADRLWSSMIRSPERTRFILETKIRPYMNILKRNNTGLYVYYDKIIMEITIEISKLKDTKNVKTGSLNADFILGYYYQKNELYTKKESHSSNINLNNKEAL